jgi:glycine dehydrogenase
VTDPLDTPAFADRHIGPSDADIDHMLGALGVSTLDELVDQAVPASIRDDKPLDLDEAASEPAVLDRLRDLAARNRVATSLIGQGYHATHTPGVILRNVMESPAWYTAYTPYQPEISQGRLEALINFQTMVCDLTGLDITNASMLDEGTAAAEAMTLCRRSTKHAGNVFFVDAECHPQTIAVVATRAEALGIDVVVGDPFSADYSAEDAFGVLLQHPGTSGVVRDLRPVIEEAHSTGALVTVATDLLACCLLVPPGELGADAAVGSSQRFGVPLGFGGPHAGFLVTRDGFKRSLPGRLVGVSVDAAGRPAYRLALQTREQHIRREKATSNICTAQVLLAVMASMYAVYHGPDGLRGIAERTHRHTTALASRLAAAGVELVHDTWFDSLTVRVPQGGAAAVHERAAAAGVNLRPVDDDTVGLSLDETTTDEIVDLVADLLGTGGAVGSADGAGRAIPADEQRTSDYLTHPVFHEHRSETEMLRYLRRLSDRDVALDRAMIPLGSCTMKLNATTEMEPVTWSEFGQIHPFVPLDQAAGYLELITDLEATLAEITGYDRVSLQPNAGSQGELAGLLAIAKYHQSRGDTARDVCLIPSSAHGTNAASAVMAGMRVVVVACDDDGNVDLDDLRAKADRHSAQLAAVMVTYPSTHGVFEARITELCDVVHDHGGQVYIDGANLNALVGVARPGWFGGDVSHLNLHKTFCIPHGGGGPGVGPVAVREHLAPFLPNHPLAAQAGPSTGPGPVSATPWGSAGILPISWAYTKLMGPDGLRKATAVAIASANYMATRLGPHYPVLYTGEHGRVAHECIIDLRPITKSTGVSVDDVAKRLIDYGFHAPTMSFPVAGTLMIEPTESESLAELDRFCDAMIAIKGEIDRVAAGEWPVADSPLRHAPHTADDLVTSDWARPYDRELAAYPVPSLRRDKYWPPVSRIDGSYGDRNLFCSCPPPEAFA